MREVLSAFRSLRAIAPFVAAHRARMLAIFMLLIVNVVAVSVPPLIFGRIVDTLGSRDILAIVGLVSLQLVVSLAGAWASYHQSVITAETAQGIGNDLRLHLAERLRKASVGFFVRRPIGEISNRLDGDIEALVGALMALAPSLLAVGTLLVALVTMPLLSWQLALVAFAFLPFWFFSGSLFGPALAKNRADVSRAKDVIETRIAEGMTFGAIIRVKSHGQYDFEDGLLRRALDAHARLFVSWTQRAGFAGLIQSGLGGVAPAVILILGALLIAWHLETIGTIVAFVGFLSRAYAPVGSLAGLQLQMVTLTGIVNRVMELFDVELECGGTERMRRSDIRFDRVAFGFDASQVFGSLSLVVRRGERVFIVGESGSGKTSMGRLLLRFYRPDRGSIYLGDCDVEEVDLQSLRRAIGYVPQESSLFSGTLHENLCYANASATPDEIERALRICQLSEFVQALPEQLETHVGSQGAMLSGGQKQRITIARTLLQHPAMLFLDEATNGLDIETERALLEALFENFDGTIVIVSHRPLRIEAHPTRVIDLTECDRATCVDGVLSA